MATPDFEQIARQVAKPHSGRWDENGYGDVVDLPAIQDDLTADIVKTLRQVWNARGAADVTAVDERLTLWLGEEPRAVHHHLADAIKEQDR